MQAKALLAKTTFILEGLTNGQFYYYQLVLNYLHIKLKLCRHLGSLQEIYCNIWSEIIEMNLNGFKKIRK